MLGHKYSNFINPNIRPIDEVLKDKNISKDARDLLLQNELKRKISELELKGNTPSEKKIEKI
jgi:hypothetical protein